MSNSESPATLSVDEARQILEPHLFRLTGCFRNAWSKWREMQEQGFTRALSSRSRASFISDFIWEEVKTQFDNEVGARTVHVRGLRALCLENQITLRFKKLDQSHRPQNILTNQQVNFAEQLPLPGFPSAVRVTMGYVLDKLQTEMQDIVVVFLEDNRVSWSFNVPDAPAAQFTVDQFSASDIIPQRERKVRVKKPKEEQGKQAANE